MTFVPAETQSPECSPDLVIVIHRGKLLCEIDLPWKPFEPKTLNSIGEPKHSHYLGILDNKQCSAVFFDQQVPPLLEGYHWVELRSLLGSVSDEYFQLAGRALQITRWYRNHQFCGVCGGKTRRATTDRALVCQNCESRFYPRISPCVIGLVKRGNMCLLAQGVRHPEGLFSTLAGFIEPGENAEQAFSREVFEEVGIRVHNINYFGSQPWPFPGQLMMGFFADYQGGEIAIDEKEIVDARWFTPETMPTIPPESTIAGQMIRAFIKQIKG